MPPSAARCEPRLTRAAAEAVVTADLWGRPVAASPAVRRALWERGLIDSRWQLERAGHRLAVLIDTAWEREPGTSDAAGPDLPPWPEVARPVRQL